MAFSSLRLHDIRVVVSTDAQTAGDAMRLAHDGGVEGGFVRPSPSGMRFNPAFLNPGTQFVVAYVDDLPIASLVLTEDGPFGLPSDRAFVEELDTYRACGDSIFETTAWVISREWRRHTAILGACLIAPAIRMNIGSSPERRMIAVVEPNRMKLIAEILGTDKVVGPRPYLMLPGSLVVTRPATEWADHFLHSVSVPRRMVADRVFDPDPHWLDLGRGGSHWADELLPELIHESRVAERLFAKLELLQGMRISDVDIAPTKALRGPRRAAEAL